MQNDNNHSISKWNKKKVYMQVDSCTWQRSNAWPHETTYLSFKMRNTIDYRNMTTVIALLNLKAKYAYMVA